MAAALGAAWARGGARGLPRSGLCAPRPAAGARRGVHVLISGPPGGGKGTISKRLKKEFEFTHLSSGDMLRAQVEKQTPLGKEALKFMSTGRLVPDEVMVDLVITELKAHQGRVLLDGFPRTLKQTLELEKVVPIRLVLNLDVPADEIVERISDRWTHTASGRVYSYSFNPPHQRGKDDETGEPLVRRPDDEPDKVRHRLAAYEAMTKPLLAHFDKKGVLESFTGENYPELLRQNRRSDAIYTDLRPLVKARLLEFEA